MLILNMGVYVIILNLFTLVSTINMGTPVFKCGYSPYRTSWKTPRRRKTASNANITVLKYVYTNA